MKTYKRSISLILCFVLLITTLFSQSIFTASAAAGENIFGDNLGTTTGSGAGIGRADTFSENWEGGLDLDKWEVVKYKTSFTSEFQVVKDPVEGSNQGNVIKVGYGGTWLIPTDEYWPTGQLYGDLNTIEFKLYLEDLNSPMNAGAGASQSNNYRPSISVYGAFSDYDDGVRTVQGLSSMDFFNSFPRTDGTVYGFWSHNGKVDIVNSLNDKGYLHPDMWGEESYAPGFVSNNWITVKINFVTGNTSFTDINGKTFTQSPPGTFYKTNKRLAIGHGSVVQTDLNNYKLSEQERCHGYYIDDIKVTFREADYDLDEAVSNVDVYYEGNVFLKPDETIALTGERLGESVLSADIARLTDDAVSLENAKYVPETHYNAYYDVDAYEMWYNKINKDALTVKSTTEEDGEFKIMSRGKVSVNMVIPPSYEEGMYALLLHPSDPSGSSELVIINNPRITLLMGDDGDYATSNGHIEIGGENFSVQDDISKVSAIILDENGNKLHLIQNTADKEYIYVDTTENNGTPNEHYMKISLEGLNLDKGNYQLMVHNGYGGDYGWSAPYSFKVDKKAAYQVWRDKGVFNVKDYGAVGDGATNDTAAVQRAINAAVENGGGMIYFPEHSNGVAFYRITKGLILKENIAIVGDGVGHSTLMFDGLMKTTIDQTRYFISYEKNLEICDIELQSAANYFEKVIYKQKTGKGKLYIHDAKFDISADSWRSNRFGGTTPDVNGVSSSTAYNSQWSNVSKLLVGGLSETYYEWDNVKKHISGHNDTYGITADYVYLNGFNEQYIGPSNNIAGFLHNCTGDELKSRRVYRNHKSVNYTSNNGELFILDGGGGEDAGTYTSIRYLNPQSYKTDLNSTLSVLSSAELTELEALVKDNENGTVFYIGKGVSVGTQLRVIGGEQGVGQLRKVTKVVNYSGKRFVVIDSPYALMPNRNSVIATLIGCVQYTYINNGEFANGSLVGVYGNANDYVFSNCTATEVSDAFICSPNYINRQWYVTFNNCTINNSSFVNNEIPQKGGTFMGQGGSGGYCVWLGLRYSNNTINGFSQITVNSGDTSTLLPHDSLLVEDVEIFAVSPAVSTTFSKYNIYLRNIHQYADAENKELSEVPWWQSDWGLRNTGIASGAVYAELPASNSQRGDVNADYFVSLPDLDAMRSYFVGKSSITTSRANLTGGDNIVDARDFLYLRAMILYKNDEEKLAEVKAAIDAITASEGGTYEEGNITIDYDGYSDDED